MTVGRAGAVIYAKDVDRLALFYSRVLALQVAERKADHVVIDSPWCQVVILQVPEAIGRNIVISSPPARRADTAIKPVFFVPSLALVRKAASASGGVMNSVEKEWHFRGEKVCDCVDPEGNVIQFRKRAG